MSHLPGSNREDGADAGVGAGGSAAAADPTGAAAAAAALASRFDQGLSLRSTMGGLGGTTSAPPPPGFNAAPDQRDGAYRLDLARGMLFQDGGGGGGGGSDGESGSAALNNAGGDGAASGGVRLGLPAGGPRGAPIGTRISEDHGGGGGLRQQGSGALLRPSELAAYASDMGRSLSAPPEDIDGQGMRSSSFANLAAALGEDLAESMNDSLQRQQQSLNLLMNGTGRNGGVHVGVGAGGQQQHLPSVAEQSGPSGGISSLQAAASNVIGGGIGSGSGSGSGSGNGSGTNGSGEIDNYARQNRHTAARLGRSSAGSMGQDVRYSSATGTAVLPPRMVLPSDTPEPSDSTGGAVIGHPHLQHPSYTAGLANRSTASTADMTPHDSGSSSGKNSPHIIHYAHQLGAPVGVTVTEPASGANTPQLIALMHGQHRDASPAINSQNGHVIVSHYGGRVSAPPSLVVDGSYAKGIGDPSRPDVVPAPSQFPSATESSSTTPSTLDYQNFSREQSPHPSMVPHHSHSSLGAPAVDRARMVQAELELEPFLWDVFGGDGPKTSPPASRTPSPMNKTSRGLAILHAAHLYIPDVRSTCEAFGALMSFRTEFCKSRGVIFVSYHDLRSARYAAVELRECLKRLATPRGTEGDKYGDILVQYCVPLNASSASDESVLVVGNLPSNFDSEQKLNNFMNSYGAVRSVRLDSLGEYTGKGNRPYIIEFYDDQDAKQALLELESDQPWGADAIVSVGLRHASERKQGQEFLALIGKWRKDEPVRVEVGATVNVTAGTTPSPLPPMEASNPRVSMAYSSASPASAGSSDASPPVPSTQPGAAPSTASTVSGLSYGVPHPGGARTHQHLPPQAVHPTTQLVVGPDGQYSYIVMNQPHPHGVPPPHPPASHHPGHTYVTHQPPMQQHIVHGPHGTYVTTVPTNQVYHTAPHGHPIPPPQYHHLPPGAVISAPYGHGHPSSVPVYTHVHGAATDSSVSSGSAVSGGMYPHPYAHGAPLQRTGPAAPPGQHRRHTPDDDPTQLLLDIESVESGKDTRTSLMVRNIPNKYTQKMLLDEFAEAGHGSDKMDFFYLPIDFKNRCNRGYAFVNFVDCRDIAAFHRQYNGKQWKVFNSDKICDITYARIQGKAAMLKRFQNSALMEKEDDYRPVVFVSSGPDKGKREEFPAPTVHHHHQHNQHNQQQQHVPHNPHVPQISSSLASAAASGAASAHHGAM